MPTHDENASPWPLWENLLASPCKPPLCVRRPLRIPMSGAASPEASLFPLTALSIESSNPIIFNAPFSLCLFSNKDEDAPIRQVKVSERSKDTQVKFRSAQSFSWHRKTHHIRCREPQTLLAQYREGGRNQRSAARHRARYTSRRNVRRNGRRPSCNPFAFELRPQ